VLHTYGEWFDFFLTVHHVTIERSRRYLQKQEMKKNLFVFVFYKTLKDFLDRAYEVFKKRTMSKKNIFSCSYM